MNLHDLLTHSGIHLKKEEENLAGFKARARQIISAMQKI